MTVVRRAMAMIPGRASSPHSDAQLEIVLAIGHIACAAGHAAKVLGPRRASAC